MIPTYRQGRDTRERKPPACDNGNNWSHRNNRRNISRGKPLEHTRLRSTEGVKKTLRILKPH